MNRMANSGREKEVTRACATGALRFVPLMVGLGHSRQRCEWSRRYSGIERLIRHQGNHARLIHAALLIEYDRILRRIEPPCASPLLFTYTTTFAVMPCRHQRLLVARPPPTSAPRRKPGSGTPAHRRKEWWRTIQKNSSCDCASCRGINYGRRGRLRRRVRGFTIMFPAAAGAAIRRQAP